MWKAALAAVLVGTLVSPRRAAAPPRAARAGLDRRAALGPSFGRNFLAVLAPFPLLFTLVALLALTVPAEPARGSRARGSRSRALPLRP